MNNLSKKQEITNIVPVLCSQITILSFKSRDVSQTKDIFIEKISTLFDFSPWIDKEEILHQQSIKDLQPWG